MKNITRSRNQFFLRAIIIAIYSVESRPEVKAVADQVRDVYGKVAKELNELSQQRASLKADANQFAQHYSSDRVADLVDEPRA